MTLMRFVRSAIFLISITNTLLVSHLYAADNTNANNTATNTNSISPTIFKAGDAALIPTPLPQSLRSNCAACHGEDGSGLSEQGEYLIGPRLSGLPENYIYQSLKDFAPLKDKNGDLIRDAQGKTIHKRVGLWMVDVAAELNESAMINFARMYSQMLIDKSPPLITLSDTQLFLRGQRLWKSGDKAQGLPSCASCHGPAGLGIPNFSPPLDGRSPEYIAVQLKRFQSGERTHTMMSDISKKMTPEDIQAVSLYGTTLRERP